MSSVIAPTSHRERKKQATRRAIHAAAFELVDSQGLSATTIEAISEKAGVAPRTFWAYFSSKEDAVIDRDPDWPARLQTALLERPRDEDAITALREVLCVYAAARLVESTEAVRRQKLIRREGQLMAALAAAFQEVERALQSAVAERIGVDPARDLTPAVLVMAACGACRLAQQRWAEEEGRRPIEELLDQAFECLARGLAPLAWEGAGR